MAWLGDDKQKKVRLMNKATNQTIEVSKSYVRFSVAGTELFVNVHVNFCYLTQLIFEL